MQLALHYRNSTLASDDRHESAKLQAGDRAPNATHLQTIEGEHRLSDLTRGGHFTLLTFGAKQTTLPDVPTLHIVQHPVEPNDLADSEGHLTDAYGAKEQTLVLIRPDGYIGLTSDTGDVAEVEDYFVALCKR
jgi:hypothetical protein